MATHSGVECGGIEGVVDSNTGSATPQRPRRRILKMQLPSGGGRTQKAPWRKLIPAERLNEKPPYPKDSQVARQHPATLTAVMGPAGDALGDAQVYRGDTAGHVQ